MKNMKTGWIFMTNKYDRKDRKTRRNEPKSKYG